MALSLTNAERHAWLAAIRLRFSSAQVGLFQADLHPSGETTLAELVECSFPGYLRQGLGTVPHVAVNPQSGRHELAWPAVPFFRSDTGEGQPAHGWFLLNDFGQLAGAERFATPKWFVTPADVYDLSARLQLWSLPTV